MATATKALTRSTAITTIPTKIVPTRATRPQATANTLRTEPVRIHSTSTLAEGIRATTATATSPTRRAISGASGASQCGPGGNS